MEVKNPLKSKTVFVAVLTGLTGVVSAIVPEFGAKLAEYSSQVMMVLSMVMIVVRKYTDGKIGWSDTE